MGKELRLCDHTGKLHSDTRLTLALKGSISVDRKSVARRKSQVEKVYQACACILGVYFSFLKSIVIFSTSQFILGTYTEMCM